MNTKSLLTRIAVPVVSLGLLGGIGATLATSAGPASAATMASVAKAPVLKTVTATTYSPNHYDTTSVPTGINVANGPLWAYDNLHETFTAVPQGNGNWAVTITVKGTFDGFASPTAANTPEHNQGNVTGKHLLLRALGEHPEGGPAAQPGCPVHRPECRAEPALRRRRERHGRRQLHLQLRQRGWRGVHPERLITRRDQTGSRAVREPPGSVMPEVRDTRASVVVEGMRVPGCGRGDSNPHGVATNRT